MRPATVHLDYRSEDTRMHCARYLSAISENVDFPILAVGDFNSAQIGFPGSHTSSSGMNTLTYLLNKGGFTSALNLSPHSQYLTFPSEKPAVIIDWVLGKGAITISDSKVIPSKLSDHLMVTAYIQFQSQADKGREGEMTP